MTPFIKSILLGMTLSLTSGVALAEDEFNVQRIATANVQKLVQEYHKSASILESLQADRKRVIEEQRRRIEEIRTLTEAGQKLQQQGEDANLSRDRKNELLGQASQKQREAQALRTRSAEWAKRQERAMQEELKVKLESLRKEVLEKIRAFGKAEGYDLILDRSATSRQRTSILNYSKDASDLTVKLLEVINEDAPAEADGE